MYFKHPELLYALALLIIPIIVHLFQLRRFEKVPFTNVKLLEMVMIKTRKSSQLKKWLVLTLRLLGLSCIILAFAQPSRTNPERDSQNTPLVMYIDNSFSMQATGNRGELLKRTVQDVLANLDDDRQFTLYTNDDVFENVSLGEVQNELLQIDYSAQRQSAQTILLKGLGFLGDSLSDSHHFIIASDFKGMEDVERFNASKLDLKLVKLESEINENVSLDSLFIIASDVQGYTIGVNLNAPDEEAVPISLYNGSELLAKTNVTGSGTAQFKLPDASIANGRITVNDNGLMYDNTLYFSINSTPAVKVLKYCLALSEGW